MPDTAFLRINGVWRSLVARTAGGREVAGSNPVAPICNWNPCIAEAVWLRKSVCGFLVCVLYSKLF